MGFQKPSKIQERALPLLLQNPYVDQPARERSHRPVQVRLTPTLVTHSFQPAQHDRTESVRNGKDCCVRVDNAVPG